MLPLVLVVVATISVVPELPLVVGRCDIALVATFVALVW